MIYLGMNLFIWLHYSKYKCSNSYLYNYIYTMKSHKWISTLLYAAGCLYQLLNMREDINYLRKCSTVNNHSGKKS